MMLTVPPEQRTIQKFACQKFDEIWHHHSDISVGVVGYGFDNDLGSCLSGPQPGGGTGGTCTPCDPSAPPALRRACASPRAIEDLEVEDTVKF